MKIFALVVALFVANQAWAAVDGEKSVLTLTPSGAGIKSDVSAVLSTNLADFTKSRANIQVDVMMSDRSAASLSYASHSEEEIREKLNNRPKLTVDRTQFGVGADFYWKPVTSMYNLAIAPSLIFQTEKDAVHTESNSGVGLRAMGLFKPLPRLMAQGGISSTVIGSKTTTDVLVGLGLLF